MHEIGSQEIKHGYAEIEIMDNMQVMISAPPLPHQPQMVGHNNLPLTSTNLLFYTVLDSSMLSDNTVYNQYII